MCGRICFIIPLKYQMSLRQLFLTSKVLLSLLRWCMKGVIFTVIRANWCDWTRVELNWIHSTRSIRIEICWCEDIAVKKRVKISRVIFSFPFHVIHLSYFSNLVSCSSWFRKKSCWLFAWQWVDSKTSYPFILTYEATQRSDREYSRTMVSLSVR